MQSLKQAIEIELYQQLVINLEKEGYRPSDQELKEASDCLRQATTNSMSVIAAIQESGTIDGSDMVELNLEQIGVLLAGAFCEGYAAGRNR